MMKWVDPSIEVVACGSSSSEMPTFGSWELDMLDQCYDNIDYVSLHRYYGNPTGDTPGFLARTMDMDDFIHSVTSICDAVKGKKHSKKQVNLSFDEWNVWYHSNEQDKEIWKREKWGRALPLLEDIYNFEDALLVGSMLLTLLRNADRVKIACLAQLVNVIAPIMTRNGGGCWAQTIYYPFMHASQYGRGTVLKAVVQSPVYDCSDYEGVPTIDTAATLSDDGSVTVFCVNRDLSEPCLLDLDLRSFGDLRMTDHIVLHHDDVKAINTEENPFNVAPATLPLTELDSGRAQIPIPPLSWNVLRFSGVELGFRDCKNQGLKQNKEIEKGMVFINHTPFFTLCSSALLPLLKAFFQFLHISALKYSVSSSLRSTLKLTGAHSSFKIRSSSRRSG